ncbi:phage major capsid protein [Vagococcus fluvialis]|uniref:Phage major capsid protein n=1 Tax=Vagococcus fluvialis TaxID=2738 RepID=A0A7X6D7D0_9ENTE|nr:phage major capsid protein [Vagococcus fluvialis]NKC67186.1 phage major capsid protein [Vagococcus fluvialis]
MKKKSMLKMNIQHFARPTFDPDTTTMQDAKTGAIPINISETILTDVKNGSAAMKLAKAVPMTKPVEQFTYMTGVGAYWVDEAERIQTDKPTFVKAEMRSKKMGVIIPTTKENLRYSVTNFFELMRAEIAEAFYKKFDQAVFTGVETPYQWNILKSATDADNLVTETKNKYDDINLAISKLEEEDLEPNGIATVRKQRVKYRSTKDNNGLPIFNTANSNGVDDLLGLPVAYTPKTSFGTSKVAEIVGDWDYAYYGILQNIEYEILTEATLTTVKDENGNPLSLAERDMAAIKATFELGFMVVKDDAFSVVTEAETTPEG